MLAVLLLTACGQSISDTNDVNGSNGKESLPEKSSNEQFESDINNDSAEDVTVDPNTPVSYSVEEGKENIHEQVEAVTEETEIPGFEGETTEGEGIPMDEGDIKIRLWEILLTFEINGKTFQDTAFLRESDTQNFSLYVLPGYILTGEEPNSDLLYLEEDSRQNMRIQLLPRNTDMNEAIATMKEQLATVSDNVVEGASLTEWDDAIVFQADNGEDLVIGILKKHEEFIIKLTIFTKVNDNYKDPFIKMGQTIDSM